ncbi:hypothetical protein MmiHf6_16230 [Methanimicrococcus hongohii]|uniref:CAAX prenyl protease 2/Lysostaphin resistance protein A-like domain-containing protein n=1 Tax=Methanimicrococcus hongohii TaxID=3028295 RepID=A0AA96ZUZ6_9EURY|nr:type II CAAX endopeptidase family protein [Methanimicrococcus sp. Hf6]WNY24292.1 hypothetical protein MmiHf6_16230 [Methanimicrococcus sp. Hf6]
MDAGITTAIPVKVERKSFRKEINRLARTLIIYEILMSIVVIAAAAYVMVQYIDMPDELYDSMVNPIFENGWLILAGIILGMFFIVLYRKRELITDLTAKNKSMTAKSFVKLFFCMMSAQVIFLVFAFFFENILNLFGYTAAEAIDSATGAEVTFSLFMYAAFIGPIAEEIVFRGAALHALKNHGKLFAIVTSAALFGLFHANFTQGVFAFFVGLVLGYVALEFSWKWAAVLHIINNFVFGEILSKLLEVIDPSIGDYILPALYIIFVVGAVITLFIERKNIKQYLSENKTRPLFYLWTFTSFWMILYILFNVIQAMLGISVLPS